MNKVNQPVWVIEINKPKDKKSYKQEGINIEETKILGISDYKIVLDTDFFVTLDKVREGRRKNREYNTYLDDTTISIRTNNNLLGDGVFATLYSTKKPTKRRVQKMVAEINNEIDKRFGYMMNTVKDELWDLADEFKY